MFFFRTSVTRQRQVVSTRQARQSFFAIQLPQERHASVPDLLPTNRDPAWRPALSPGLARGVGEDVQTHCVFDGEAA